MSSVFLLLVETFDFDTAAVISVLAAAQLFLVHLEATFERFAHGEIDPLEITLCSCNRSPYLTQLMTSHGEMYK